MGGATCCLTFVVSAHWLCLCQAGSSCNVDLGLPVQEAGSAMLQKTKITSMTSLDLSAVDEGTDENGQENAPLTEQGFADMSSECCFSSFDEFSRRLLSSLGMEICDEGCFNGWIPFFTCGQAQTLKNYTDHIQKNSNELCACFALTGKCRTGGLPKECIAGKYNPTWHRRRVCAKQSTTKKVVTTTTAEATTTLAITTTPLPTTTTLATTTLAATTTSLPTTTTLATTTLAATTVPVSTTIPLATTTAAQFTIVDPLECWSACYAFIKCHSTCTGGNQPIGSPPQCATSGSNQCQGQGSGWSFSYNGPQCQCQCPGFSFTTNGPGQQTQVQPSSAAMFTLSDMEMKHENLNNPSKRCNGAPLTLGGKTWNNLGTQGDAQGCSDACQQNVACFAAVYNENNKQCSAFADCDKYRTEQSGKNFLVFKKSCK